MESPFCPACEGKSDEHAVRWTHAYGHAERMGSGCSGERQGQEIVDAAILAGMQSATPLGPANLAGTRSDSTMQQEWCSSPMQRIYGEDQRTFGTRVTLVLRRRDNYPNLFDLADDNEL